MTRSIRESGRAALLLAGMAAATGLLLSGCGAGQIAETAYKQSSIGGINAQTPDDVFKIRNVNVAYLNTEGYPAGGTAPLEMAIYNDSTEPVTVTVTTESAQSIVLIGATVSPSASPSSLSASPSSPSTSPSASASVTADATVSPTAQVPTGTPAVIEIPAGEFAQLSQESGTFLQLVGLDQDLRPGNSVNLVFDFGGKAKIETPVPMAVPLTPAPPASPVIPGQVKGGEPQEKGH